jgi:hypothetical protein
MAYVPNSNSVVAFQSNPSSLLSGVSVVGLTPVGLNVGGNPVSTTNPVAVQPPASGSLPVINVGSIITVSQGSIGAYIIGGSVAVSVTPPANQSVSGTVQTDVRGSIATVIIGGSIAASFTPPANQSVSGEVSISNFPTTQNVSGSVVATQGTNPWIVTGSVQASLTPVANQSVSGTVQVDVRGSVATVIIGGSIATTTGNSSVQVLNFPANQSVSGAVSISNFPTTQNVSGSVVATQGTTPWQVVSSLAGGIFPISGSVAAVITNTNINVGGSVVAFQGGTNISSISGQVTVVSSLAGGIFPISGSVAAAQIGTRISSISGIPTVQVVTSVAAVQSGTWRTSVLGTYAEDATHATGDVGMFMLGVRNDTLASVTSADLEYTQISLGPIGEQIVANAPITKWVQGTTSIMYGPSVAVIAAQGASIFTYVTGVQITNDSANYSRVTFQGASSSVIGYVPAPANGGAVFTLPNAWKSNANGAITASISGVSSVYLSLQGFISKV